MLFLRYGVSREKENINVAGQSLDKKNVVRNREGKGC